MTSSLRNSPLKQISNYRLPSSHKNFNYRNKGYLNVYNVPLAVALFGGAVFYHTYNKPSVLREHVPKRYLGESADSGDDYLLSERSTESNHVIRDTILDKMIGHFQLNANEKIEDRLVSKLVNVGDEKAVLCAVIDGHGGHRVASLVQHNLDRYLQIEIDRRDVHNSRDSVALRACLLGAFERLDKDLYQMTKVSLPNMAPWRRWKVGACCLATLITSRECIVANAGDCEGLLVHPRFPKKYIEIAEPHSANEPKEQKRLKKEHPGEDDVVKCKRSKKVPVVPTNIGAKLLNCVGLYRKTETVTGACYVKGRLMPTKSFGDFHLKFEECSKDVENNKTLVNKPYSYPYITASPNIYSSRASRFSPTHLILGSDGVFDFLEHQEIHKKVREYYYGGLSPQQISSRLVHDTITKAALCRDTTVQVLMNTPFAGKKRRRMFDDTSVCVVDVRGVQLLLNKLKKYC